MDLVNVDAPTHHTPVDHRGRRWAERAALLAGLRGDTSLDTESYVWLVWARTQRRAGHLNADQRQMLGRLDAPLSGVAEGPWERRFRQVALRDMSGLTLAGQWRTQWLTRQRRARAQGTLDRGKVALLDRLRGFDWTPGDAQWEETFAKVARFADEHGHIPTRADDVRMSNWLATQRLALRADRLRYDRVQALNGLPGWSAALSSTRSRQPWERQCEQLRVFLERVGRYPSADSADPAEVGLASWVTAQREQVRRDGLSPYRIQALSALPGWRWSARDAAWDERFAQVRTELSRSGSIGRDHPLYTWVVAQRRRHRDGRLRPEQVSALRELNLLGDRLTAAA